MATPHLQIADIDPNQDQKEVTANAAHADLDRAMNQLDNTISMTAGDVILTAVEQRENAYLELTGTPGTARNLDMFDTNERVLTVFNNCDSQVTVRNSASGGSGQPVLASGSTVTFQYDGTNFLEGSRISATAKVGFIPLPLGSLRLITADDIGVVLGSGTEPEFERVATTTDKALRVTWDTTNDQDEVQFDSIPMPIDLDSSKDVTVHILGRMSAGTDTSTAIDVQAFDGIGDTEMGGLTTPDFTSTLAEVIATINAADIIGPPLGFLSLSLVPEAHTNDNLEIYAAWIEYTKK